MFDSKKLAASCAAVASLAMFGLAGTAMAVETPTTGDTAAASITLNAAEGNTLAGHTFTFYRLGSYGDITAGTTGTDVKSLTVNKIDDASDKWIAAANAKAGITDLQGFDAAGDLAHVGKDGEPTGSVQGKLREAAKQLAATAGTDSETFACHEDRDRHGHHDDGRRPAERSVPDCGFGGQSDDRRHAHPRTEDFERRHVGRVDDQVEDRRDRQEGVPRP